MKVRAFLPVLRRSAIAAGARPTPPSAAASFRSYRGLAKVSSLPRLSPGATGFERIVWVWTEQGGQNGGRGGKWGGLAMRDG